MSDRIAQECELPDGTRIRLCSLHIGRYPDARVLEYSLGEFPNKWLNSWPNKWPTQCKGCAIEEDNAKKKDQALWRTID